MPKSPLRNSKVDKDNEFQAPDWVSDASIQQAVTKKQRQILNISLLIVVVFCLWAGWFEFGRAQSGNWRAWVYTFEWPFFAAVSIYLWRRLSKGDIPHIPRPNLENSTDHVDGKDGE